MTGLLAAPTAQQIFLFQNLSCRKLMVLLVVETAKKYSMQQPIYLHLRKILLSLPLLKNRYPGQKGKQGQNLTTQICTKQISNLQNR